MKKHTLIRNCRLEKPCDKKWEELSLSSPKGLLKNLRIDNVRYCEKCSDFVWKCENKEELIKAITLNRCVAFFDWDGEISGYKNQRLLGSAKISK